MNAKQFATVILLLIFLVLSFQSIKCQEQTTTTEDIQELERMKCPEHSTLNQICQQVYCIRAPCPPICFNRCDCDKGYKKTEKGKCIPENEEDCETSTTTTNDPNQPIENFLE